MKLLLILGIQNRVNLIHRSNNVSDVSGVVTSNPFFVG
jgi:hypothetical protein